mgnify:CR=1 FL=1
MFLKGYRYGSTYIYDTFCGGTTYVRIWEETVELAEPSTCTYTLWLDVQSRISSL